MSANKYLRPKVGLYEITNGHGTDKTGETSDLSFFFVSALLEHPEGIQARHLAGGLRSLETRGMSINFLGLYKPQHQKKV